MECLQHFEAPYRVESFRVIKEVRHYMMLCSKTGVLKKQELIIQWHTFQSEIHVVHCRLMTSSSRECLELTILSRTLLNTDISDIARGGSRGFLLILSSGMIFLNTIKFRVFFFLRL